MMPALFVEVAMGYHTEFSGELTLTPALSPAQVAYLQAFAASRRTRRDATRLRSDAVREAVGLPVGRDGAFYVGDDEEAVLDYNNPPADQPGLWCQWVPSDDGTTLGTTLGWDEGEKFYEYVDWMRYLVEHFLQPWGVQARGRIEWRGEEWRDTGALVVDGYEVRVVGATI